MATYYSFRGSGYLEISCKADDYQERDPLGWDFCLKIFCNKEGGQQAADQTERRCVSSSFSLSDTMFRDV